MSALKHDLSIDINNTTFYNNHVYIINSTINVLNHVILTVEKEVIILLKTNIGQLIFQNGSTLIGYNIDITSCDNNNKIINEFNKLTEQNNKLIFNGDNTQIKVKFLNVNFVGTMQLNNIVKKNFDVYKLSLFYSGKNGIEINNSCINFQKIHIKNPQQNGIYLNGSIIKIKKTIKIIVESIYTNGTGYGLFYLNNLNNFQQYIKINCGTKVGLNGSRFYPIINYIAYTVNVNSECLPQPINNISYIYNAEFINCKTNVIVSSNNVGLIGPTGATGSTCTIESTGPTGAI